MTKRLLYIFLIFQSLLASGQSSSYKPFPTTYGNWVYRYYDNMHNPTSTQRQYTLNGDTVISSVSYKKIFFNSIYKGALRENSKIIYFIPDTSSTQHLLYNFNLTTGSQVIHPFGGAICTNDTLTVAFIDSVLVSDGYHKRFNFNPVAPQWIEGIGSTEYLLNPLQTFCVSGNDLLECMINNSVFNYPTGQLSCVASVFEHFESSIDISIFPNPSYGSFTIDFKGADITEIILTDVFGKTVLRQLTKNQNKINIDNLNKGTFFLTLVDRNYQRMNRKLISSP